MPTLVRAGTVQMTRQRQITIYAQAPGEREGALSQVGFSGVSQKNFMVYCMWLAFLKGGLNILVLVVRFADWGQVCFQEARWPSTNYPHTWLASFSF